MSNEALEYLRGNYVIRELPDSKETGEYGLYLKGLNVRAATIHKGHKSLENALIKLLATGK